jgi:hypothetical protein
VPERDPILDAELAAAGIVEGDYPDEEEVELTTLVDPAPGDRPAAMLRRWLRAGTSAISRTRRAASGGDDDAEEGRTS